MPVTQRILTRNSPGTYVNEDTFGAVPTILRSFGTAYVLGTCTSTSFPYNTPTYIANYQDFLTQCISSPSAAAIQMFFDQRSGSGLYFIRVPLRQAATLVAATFTPGTVLTVTVSGTTVSYVCITGDTAITAADAIGLKVSQVMAGVVNYNRDSAGVAYLRTPVGTTPTVSAGLTLGAPILNATPIALDVADSIRYSFVPELAQGYLCAPEFFQAFTTQAERTTLQLQMEAFAADPNYYWVAVIDSGLATAQGVFFVTAIQAERATFVSPRGNSILTYPYLLNLANVPVPPSLAQIGVALRRQRSEGFQQPPAGVNYPIYGVSGTTVNITSSVQDQLNPLGINCIRTLPARGIVVYGARTLSVNPFYLFVATRVILNVLAGTLSESFDSLIFTLVDGQGVLLTRIRQTASNLCELLRLAGALYGATPADAYLVICDETNNTLISLESGAVYLEVIVKPSPTMEVLNITLSRASLSTVLVEVVSAGDTAAVKSK